MIIKCVYYDNCGDSIMVNDGQPMLGEKPAIARTDADG